MRNEMGNRRKRGIKKEGKKGSKGIMKERKKVR